MPTGSVRTPRVQIQTSGGSFTPLECDISLSQLQSSGTFRATLVMDDPLMGDTSSFWSDTAPIQVTITASSDTTSGQTQMFTGNVDKVYLLLQERTINIGGRDLTSKLIESKTNEKWLNKQPQDIIQDLAGRAGLSVEFGGTSSDRAGLKYNQDYNRISELDTYWNVIVRLARDLGCIAFVNGMTLFVQPWNQTKGGSFQLWYRPPTPSSPAQANFICAHLSRDVSLAKTLVGSQTSWRHKEGESVESEFQCTGQDSDTKKWEFNLPNGTKQQCDTSLKARLDEIASQERQIEVETYGDISITPNMMVQLTGTGTGFDQSYIITEVIHRWRFKEGYKMTIRARNKDSKRGDTTQAK